MTELDKLPFEDADAEADGQPIVPARVGGRGRRTGSTNKTSRQLARYMAFHGLKDPGIAQLEIVNADPVELRAWLREAGNAEEVPSLFEVLQWQALVADRVHPYIRGKRPLDVNLRTNLPLLHLQLGDGGGRAHAGVSGAIDLFGDRPQENQRVSDDPPEGSHATKTGGDS